ncbi:LysR substrate-binding domain-containing protein [Kiloniella laminariae]|uniref:LysR substrate-binding domain-containing protein n=1 Tax=Kiloniella laminariae TaxID=454162 RepID=A0ABT4LNV8_9PROT|nr:LysR substrate-binding domain-containing protein [Kiloniella laminariae]MCZ4282767.1 LysR substrate-binding domain-containing protein [Kiloniella laminariae]
MPSLRKRLPSLNGLLAFEAAAKHESFTAAAKELGVHQPSISRHISLLEEFMGRNLFVRSNNQLSLTEEGRRLWQAVNSGLGLIADTADELREPPDQGVVTVACSFGFAHQWLLARYGVLRKAVAPVKVKLLTTDHHIEYDQEEAEILVRFGQGDWPDCFARKLFEEEVFPVCSPDFLARHPDLNKVVSPNKLAEMLKKLPLLHYDTGGQGWLTWDLWFKMQSVSYQPPSDVTYYENYPFQIRATLDGEGISLGWSCLVSDHLAKGELVSLCQPIKREKWGYYLICRKNLAARPSVKAVFDWFSKA